MGPRLRGDDALWLPYFTAEKRPPNELAGMIGCAPATRASFAGGAAGSETVGLNGGRTAAATLVSAGFGAGGLGTAAEGRGVSFASMTFGLPGTAVAVVSLVSPTLRARLLKKPPSDLTSVATD